MFCCASRVWGYVASMDWQQLVSLGIVASAVVLLVRSRFGRRKFSFERDTHCGCAAVQESSPPGSIIFHARKGARPEIVVRMR